MTDRHKSIALGFARSETGATAVECGTLVATIAVVLVAVLQATGTSLGNMFSFVARTITGATP